MNSAKKCDSNCDWLRVDKKTQSANSKESVQTGKAMSDNRVKDSTWCFPMQGKKNIKKERIFSISTIIRDISQVIIL